MPKMLTDLDKKPKILSFAINFGRKMTLKSAVSCHEYLWTHFLLGK